MKKIYSILSSLLIIFSLNAQAPLKMSYQAVIRNSSNQLVASHAVRMKISILQTSASGTAVYVETQTQTTNVNGLVTIVIGSGTVVSGTFKAINWSNGPYFIKTETDPAGGTSYTITNTSQLMSVPYAIYANIADSIVGGITESDPVFNASVSKKITAADTTKWSNKQDKPLYYLGQVKDGGVIFYIYTDNLGQEHGLIVSETESTGIWQNTGTSTGANRSWDGEYNTGLMTDSPIKNYVTGLGSGWYIPSIDELRILFNSRYQVNKALNAIGGSILMNYDQYWSSTENGSGDGLLLYFFNGGSSSGSKTNDINCRAIRAF